MNPDPSRDVARCVFGLAEPQQVVLPDAPGGADEDESHRIGQKSAVLHGRSHHYLAAVGEATEVPRRSPNRGPPYWKSRVLRRLGDEEDGSHSGGGDEAP